MSRVPTGATLVIPEPPTAPLTAPPLIPPAVPGADPSAGLRPTSARLVIPEFKFDDEYDTSQAWQEPRPVPLPPNLHQAASPGADNVVETLPRPGNAELLPQDYIPHDIVADPELVEMHQKIARIQTGQPEFRDRQELAQLEQRVREAPDDKSRREALIDLQIKQRYVEVVAERDAEIKRQAEEEGLSIGEYLAKQKVASEGSLPLPLRLIGEAGHQLARGAISVKDSITDNQSATRTAQLRESMREQEELFRDEDSLIGGRAAKLLRKTGGVVGSMTPALTAAYITKDRNLAYKIMGGQAGIEAYGQARAKGWDSLDAIAYGTASGAIEMVTERISPLESIFAGKSAVKGLMGGLVAAMGEGVEEVVAEILQSGKDVIMGMDPDALKKMTAEELLETGAVGFLAGGALSGVPSAINYLAKPTEENALAVGLAEEIAKWIEKREQLAEQARKLAEQARKLAEQARKATRIKIEPKSLTENKSRLSSREQEVPEAEATSDVEEGKLLYSRGMKVLFKHDGMTLEGTVRRDVNPEAKTVPVKIRRKSGQRGNKYFKVPLDDIIQDNSFEFGENEDKKPKIKQGNRKIDALVKHDIVTEDQEAQLRELAKTDPEALGSIFKEAGRMALDHNTEIDAMRDEYRHLFGQNLAAKVRAARSGSTKGKDADATFRAFDLIAQKVRDGNFPRIAALAESLGNGDLENGLFEVLQGGIGQFQRVKPHDMISEVLEQVRASEPTTSDSETASDQFELKNDGLTPKSEEFESTSGKQKTLISGIGKDLPGQEVLFDVDGTDATTTKKKEKFGKKPKPESTVEVTESSGAKRDRLGPKVADADTMRRKLAEGDAVRVGENDYRLEETKAGWKVNISTPSGTVAKGTVIPGRKSTRQDAIDVAVRDAESSFLAAPKTESTATPKLDINTSSEEEIANEILRLMEQDAGTVEQGAGTVEQGAGTEATTLPTEPKKKFGKKPKSRPTEKTPPVVPPAIPQQDTAPEATEKAPITRSQRKTLNRLQKLVDKAVPGAGAKVEHVEGDVYRMPVSTGHVLIQERSQLTMNKRSVDHALETHGLEDTEENRQLFANPLGKFKGTLLDLTLPSGKKIDALGLIQLKRQWSKNSESHVLRHELIHAARHAGVMPKEQFDELAARYAPGAKTDGEKEERIARAAQAWGNELNRDAMSWIDKLLQLMGVDPILADQLEKEVFGGKILAPKKTTKTSTTETTEPAPKTEATKPDRPIAKKAKKARGEASEALADLRKKLSEKGLLPSTGFDPEIAQVAALAAAKSIKAGVLTFAEFVDSIVNEFGPDVTRRIAAEIEDAWKRQVYYLVR